MTFVAASVMFLLGALFMSAAPGYKLLLLGRMITGLGVGTGLAIDPLYISEISPPCYRGMLVRCGSCRRDQSNLCPLQDPLSFGASPHSSVGTFEFNLMYPNLPPVPCASYGVIKDPMPFPLQYCKA